MLPRTPRYASAAMAMLTSIRRNSLLASAIFAGTPEAVQARVSQLLACLTASMPA